MYTCSACPACGTIHYGMPRHATGASSCRCTCVRSLYTHVCTTCMYRCVAPSVEHRTALGGRWGCRRGVIAAVPACCVTACVPVANSLSSDHAIEVIGKEKFPHPTPFVSTRIKMITDVIVMVTHHGVVTTLVVIRAKTVVSPAGTKQNFVTNIACCFVFSNNKPRCCAAHSNKLRCQRR